MHIGYARTTENGVAPIAEVGTITRCASAVSVEREWTKGEAMDDLEAVRFVESYKLERFITDGLNSGKFGYDAVEILSEIYVLERYDVAPVVRCKDCVCYEEHDGDGWCYEHDRCVKADDFCSCGERRNDE